MAEALRKPTKGQWPDLAIFVFCAWASVMSKSGYLCSCIERHIEDVVHPPFAEFARCVVFSLLQQRRLPSRKETWRQIAPKIQVFRLLFAWLMARLPNLSAMAYEMFACSLARQLTARSPCTGTGFGASPDIAG